MGRAIRISPIARRGSEKTDLVLAVSLAYGWCASAPYRTAHIRGTNRPDRRAHSNTPCAICSLVANHTPWCRLTYPSVIKRFNPPRTTYQEKIDENWQHV